MEMDEPMSLSVEVESILSFEDLKKKLYMIFWFVLGKIIEQIG